MNTRIFCIITLSVITLASCKISQEAYLRPDNPWSPYEKAIDASQNCEQIHSVYMAYCKRLVALDGHITASDWKTYTRSTNFLERKMNRKARKYCGCRYFDNIWDVSFSPSDGDGVIPQDDFDYEIWEDNFDYDEFDSTR